MATSFCPPIAYPGLMLKDSYWRWPERELAGNTIDIFMRVLGLFRPQMSSSRLRALRRPDRSPSMFPSVLSMRWR